MLNKFIKNLDRIINEQIERPRNGAYYWFPLKESNNVEWILLPFFDDSSDNLHENIWDTNIIYKLGREWGKKPNKFIGLYSGLPRGRVTVNYRKNYKVYWGNDSPIEFEEAKKQIRSAFNLPYTIDDKDLFEYDEHECMHEFEYDEVQEIIGKKFYKNKTPHGRNIRNKKQTKNMDFNYKSEMDL